MTHTIGIMADSHGQAAKLAEAIRFFQLRQCRRIYHLGDICDSLAPETADACIRLMAEHGVRAVRGNNDQALLASSNLLSPSSSAYLQGLPLIREEGEALFAHSLPFARELGLSCMVRNMGPEETNRFFTRFPRKVLFRGHSHVPGIVWQEKEQRCSRSLAPGEKTGLSGLLPCVVTCGALTRGFVMIWEPDTYHLTCSVLLPGDA